MCTGRRSAGLLAHSPVDPLAEEVCVAVVPGVFLDHVHQHLAQHVAPFADDVEVGRLRHVSLRECDLGAPCVPRLCDNLGVGHRAVEVPVGVGVGSEVPRYVLPGHPQPEPRLFHVGHVAHQPQQRQVGGLDGTTGQVGGVQAGALELQCQVLVTQVTNERGALPLEPPVGPGASSGWTNMSDQPKLRARSSSTRSSARRSVSESCIEPVGMPQSSAIDRASARGFRRRPRHPARLGQMGAPGSVHRQSLPPPSPRLRRHVHRRAPGRGTAEGDVSTSGSSKSRDSTACFQR